MVYNGRYILIIDAPLRNEEKKYAETRPTAVVVRRAERKANQR